MKKLIQIFLIGIFFSACRATNDTPIPQQNARVAQDPFAKKRYQMVERQIQWRGIKDTLVLKAMRNVPRHLFVPDYMKGQAYRDSPLPIGEGQTISQPYIVAFMTEALQLKGDEKVLEIGTGSGYQAAVLAEIAKELYTIEIVPSLGLRAEQLLKKLGYKNTHVKVGDGYRGLPEQAPFDAVIVTAAPGHIPKPLVDQLKKGGRMIIPVGDYYQELILITKKPDGTLKKQSVLSVRFVPMTGEAEKKKDD